MATLIKRVLAVVDATALPIALSFSGGYADASSYLITSSFTGHITGNTILAALAVGSGDVHTLLIRLVAIACFCAATYAGLLFAAKNSDDLTAITAMTLVECALVALAPVGIVVHAPGASLILIVCLCFTLGMQNGVYRRIGHVGIHTTYVTGDLTNLLTAVAQRVSSFGKVKTSATERSMTTDVLTVWIAFASGSLAAGVSVHVLGARAVWLLVIPLVVAFIVSSNSKKGFEAKTD